MADRAGWATPPAARRGGPGRAIVNVSRAGWPLLTRFGGGVHSAPSFATPTVNRLSLLVLAALVALASPLVAEPVAAQDFPIRWGRISDAERALTAVEGDADAAAIVLGDVGDAKVDYNRARDDFRLVLRRHRRVKVLSEGGYGLGEFSLRYPASAKVRNVKGQTFVPEPDGSLRRVELPGRSVVDGSVDRDTREVRFSMPGLAPGAIFEFEYVYESDGLFAPPVWYFQSEEPTLASEFRFETPDFFQYMQLTQGDRVQAEQTTGGYQADWRTTRYRWTAADVPALREEPYTTTEEDYAQKLTMQLRQVSPPGGFVRTVLGSWPDVAQALASDESFGRRLRAGRRVRALVEGVTGTDAERARAVYDRVREAFVWNGRRGVFADRNLDDVAEARTGSVAELNLLLTSALREAGVDATPVLLSTRPNGRAVSVYPLVSQFDWVVVLVRPEGGEGALLDATDRNLPYGYLPVVTLNGAGWIADPARPEWFSFDAPGGTSTSTTVQAAVDADGHVAGTVRIRLTGYAALDARTELDDEAAGAPAAAAAAAAEEAADAPDGVEMTDVTVDGDADPYAPLTMTAAFTASASAEVVGDEVYLVPFVVTQLDENPFERPERTFPVDFAYPSTRTYVADIALPEGYAVESVPALVQLTIPSRAVSYQRAVVAEPGRLVVRSVLTVAQSRVQPEEYAVLRALYDEIVAAETEAVVLTRAAPATPPAAAVAEVELAPASTDR